MNLSYHELLDLAWRRPLTAEEQARLNQLFAENPSLQEDWALEKSLATSISRLPDLPVSSNFTSQVLLAASRPGRSASDFSRRPGWFGWGWAPRLAAAMAVLLLSVITFHEHQVASRVEMAQSVARLSTVATLLKIEWLKDFEAIHELRSIPTIDDDRLLSVLESKN